MSLSHKEQLQKNRSELVRNIDLNGMLLANLQSNEAITKDQADRIEHANISQKTGLLLDIIGTRADPAFYKLIDALRESNQAHLAKHLQSESGRMN